MKKKGYVSFVLHAHLPFVHHPESDDYLTVGGWILNEYQSFPKLNEVITCGNWKIKVIKKTASKIEEVILSSK